MSAYDAAVTPKIWVMSRDLEERAMRAEEAGAGGGCWWRFSQCDGEMKMRGGAAFRVKMRNDRGFTQCFQLGCGWRGLGRCPHERRLRAVHERRLHIDRTDFVGRIAALVFIKFGAMKGDSIENWGAGRGGLCLQV
jgi:hypothetical protein